MPNPPEILIIEDDPQIRRFLRATLSAEQYRFHEALTAAEGMAQAQARQPDLILLDLGLPDQDGLEVIRSLRQTSQTPIIVLSARGQEKDKIEALDLGADDFVSKPFAVGELLARMRAALRRAATIGMVPTGRLFAQVISLSTSMPAWWGQRIRSSPHADRVPVAGNPRAPRRESRYATPVVSRSLGSAA